VNDFILKVHCPNDGSECSVVGGEIMESMVLLGDAEQNMQCLTCGFGSNSNMKKHIKKKPFPDEFKDICKEVGDRFWAPSVFTTENYQVIPKVMDKKLNWKIIPNDDPTTEVVVPTFADAFKMVEKMEHILGEKIQQ
jgi:hypothetical protein